MANSVRDYTPGISSYKLEEGGSLKDIESTADVDHQFGTLNFHRDDFTVNAMGLNLSLSSRFNSDHLYSTTIKKAVDGLPPLSLSSLPEGQTNFYRLANGWSFDLPFIITSTPNTFLVSIGGKTFDLAPLLTPTIWNHGDPTGNNSAPTESWIEGYHVRYGSVHDSTYRHVIVAIPEAKIIVEGEVLQSGTSPNYDYTIVNASTYPFKLHLANGALIRFAYGQAGYVSSISDVAGKYSLTFSYLDSLVNCTGLLSASPTPTRSSFTIPGASYALVKPGDLFLIRDEARVVWSKDGNNQVTVSGGFNFVPGSADTFVIGSARISTIAHTDGRAVKFYYYSDSMASYITTLLSSDNVRNNLHVGDLFLKRYTIDSSNNLVKYEVLDTLTIFEKTHFDTGGSDALTGPSGTDPTYFNPLQNNSYVYSLTANVDPATDFLQIINNAGAPTTFTFQSGGFCVHTYNQKNIFSTILREGCSTTGLVVERPDNIIQLNMWVGVSRPNYVTGLDANGNPVDADWSSQTYTKPVAKYGAASKFSQVSSIKTVKNIVLSNPLTVAPMINDECIFIDNAVVKAANPQRSIQKDTSNLNPTRVYLDTSSLVTNDYIAIRNEVRKIVNVGNDGSAFVDIDYMFSFLPLFSTGADWCLLIDGQLIPNNYSEYYLNKPKVVKITYQQTPIDAEWKSRSFAYIYLKRGDEVRDDINGGGFTWADTLGPSTTKNSPDDIELSRTLVFAFSEGRAHSTDYTQEVHTFQYDDKKRLMGEKEVRFYKNNQATWVPVSLKVNVLGNPCANLPVYGITGFYLYMNTDSYSSAGGIPDDLNWKQYVINEFDAYGRVVRSRKYASCLPGGQAILTWTQYVGIGSLLANSLDPYAKFIYNSYSVNYQSLFNTFLCFEIVAAQISTMDAVGDNAIFYNQFDLNMNLTAKRIVEKTQLSPIESNYSALNIKADDGAGNVRTDPTQIFWKLDASAQSNVWSNSLFTLTTQNYGYGSRDCIYYYAYDANNRLLTTTKPAGNVVSLAYGISPAWSSAYVALDIVEFDNNIGGVSQYNCNAYIYDIKGRVVQTTTYMSSTSDGNIGHLYDGGGIYPQKVVARTFDGLDRVLVIRGGSSSLIPVLGKVYDDIGRTLTITDYLGFRKILHYDWFYRLCEIEKYKPNVPTNDLNHSPTIDVRIGHSLISYDTMANKIYEKTRYTSEASSNASRWVTRYTYDELGRVTAIQYKNTDAGYGGDGAPSLLTEMCYDDLNNTVTTREYLGNSAAGSSYIQTQVDYDWLGRGAIREHTWSGQNGAGAEHITQHFFDYVGNKTKTILPSEEQYVYLYNTNRRLEQILYPDGTSSIYNYDVNGNVIRTIDRRLIEIDTAYNHADVPVLVSTYGDLYGGDILRIATLVTHHGPAIVTESHGATTGFETSTILDLYNYYWTGSATLFRRTFEFGAPNLYLELNATYDSGGNQTTLTANSPVGTAWNKTVTINRQLHLSNPDTDHLNRTLIGTNDATPKQIIMQEFNYLGLLDQIQFSDANGNLLTNLMYTYDKYLRPLRIVSSDAALDLNLTRDFAGNILARLEPRDGSVVNNAYSYDGTARISTGEGESDTYDELSNLVTRNAKTYTYQDIGAGNNKMRLASFFDGANVYSYTYDSNGNLTSITNRFTNIKYDNLNRLREIDFVGAQVDKYWYDRKGLRCKKEEHSELAPTGNIKTYTMYIGELPILIEKYVGSTKTETRFNLIGE